MPFSIRPHQIIAAKEWLSVVLKAWEDGIRAQERKSKGVTCFSGTVIQVMDEVIDAIENREKTRGRTD